MNRELMAIAELACARAKKQGAQQVAAAVRRNRHYKVVLRDGKLEELKSYESQRLALRLFVNGRYSRHTTSDLRKDALLGFVDDATAMTGYLMADKLRALPQPALYEGRSSADLGLFDPKQREVTMDQRKRRAREALEAARAAAGDALLSVAAGTSDRLSESVLVQSNGFADGDRRTGFAVWADVSVHDKKLDKRPSDWAESMARVGSELGSGAAVGREAAERALARMGADKIPSCELPLVVENRAVGRLLRGLLGPLSGWALDQKRSCLDGKQGSAIAAALLTLEDDPLLSAGWGSRRYDGEGISARKRPLVQAGVLKNYFIDSYYGRKLKRAPTSGQQSNLVFSGGEGDCDALCAAAGKALLVTQFIGGNSNSTTGDFSHGLAGFLIEDGKRSRPVASMNLSGNHLELWKSLTRLGGDPYPHASARTPSLLFAPRQIAGR